MEREQSGWLEQVVQGIHKETNTMKAKHVDDESLRCSDRNSGWGIALICNFVSFCWGEFILFIQFQSRLIFKTLGI